MEGVIASVQPGTDQARLTVDADARDGAPPQRVVVLVASDTEVTVRQGDGTSRAGRVADLAAGARILIRHTGMEMRSLPPQYRATHVRVLGGG